MWRKKIFVRSLVSLSFIVLISCEKEEIKQKPHCIVLFYTGKVKITDPLTSTVRIPQIKGIIKENEIIETGIKSTLVIQIKSMASIRILENSHVKIDTILKNGKDTKLTVQNGKVFSKLKKLSKNSSYGVSTPNSFAAVRGTSFLTSYSAKGKTSSIAVHKGVVKVTTVKGIKKDSVVLKKNKTAIVTSKKKIYTKHQNEIKQLELKKLNLHTLIKKPEKKSVEEIKNNFQSKEISNKEKFLNNRIIFLKEIPKLSPLDRLRKMGKELTFFKLTRGQIIGHIVSQNRKTIKLDTGDGIIELPKRKIVQRRPFK